MADSSRSDRANPGSEIYSLASNLRSKIDSLLIYIDKASVQVGMARMEKANIGMLHVSCLVLSA